MSMMDKSTKARAFSLVELVIVIVIIGIIAAIAVPRISRGAKGAGDAAARMSLAGLRNAIDMYAAEHGGDFPGDCATCLGSETEVIDHLIKKTDGFGNVGVIAGTHIYGPYLRTGFPPLPVCALKGSSTVSVITAGDPVPTGAGTDGWIYSTETGKVVANCADTELDETGDPYNQY